MYAEELFIYPFQDHITSVAGWPGVSQDLNYAPLKKGTSSLMALNRL